jgi:putative transcription antitermination factor YqgF
MGLAVNQDFLAQPLKIIHYQNQDEALEEIVNYCNKNQIKKIILGISENETARKTRRFEKKLQDLLSIPIIYFDETLSSSEVIARMKLRSKPIPKYIDHFAAAFILEEWLALENSSHLDN